MRIHADFIDSTPQKRTPMTAKIIDGKAIAAQERSRIATIVQEIRADGRRQPGLAVVLVGENPASAVYVRNKKKACAEVGIESFSLDFPASVTEETLLAEIDRLNADVNVDGILVQLPLPSHINEALVTERILPHKDVDGFHPENIGHLTQKKPVLRPCTPYGVIRLIESTGETIAGKRATVVGASNIVGRPMALELLLANATVTICNSKTRDVAAEVNRADIVVAGVGIPEFVKGDWIQPGAMVLDVGINRAESGGLVGDVEFERASQNAGWITPVPGGVGPMTVAMLMHNTIMAWQNHN